MIPRDRILRVLKPFASIAIAAAAGTQAAVSNASGTFGHVYLSDLKEALALYSELSALKDEGWQVPDGYKLVPIEPTPIMNGQGSLAYREYDLKAALQDGRAMPVGDIYRAMLAAAPVSPSVGNEGWQEIATAPKDGTAILLFPQMVTATWDFGAENWIVMTMPLDKDTRTIAVDWSRPAELLFELMADIGGVSPTHWMPLPLPPPPQEEGK